MKPNKPICPNCKTELIKQQGDCWYCPTCKIHATRADYDNAAYIKGLAEVKEGSLWK